MRNFPSWPGQPHRPPESGPLRKLVQLPRHAGPRPATSAFPQWGKGQWCVWGGSHLPWTLGARPRPSASLAQSLSFWGPGQPLTTSKDRPPPSAGRAGPQPGWLGWPWSLSRLDSGSVLLFCPPFLHPPGMTLGPALTALPRGPGVPAFEIQAGKFLPCTPSAQECATRGRDTCDT